MEHKGSAGIQDSVSCGLLACSVATTKGWPISRNCGVAGLTCMLILRREELLILSFNNLNSTWSFIIKSSSFHPILIPKSHTVLEDINRSQFKDNCNTSAPHEKNEK